MVVALAVVAVVGGCGIGVQDRAEHAKRSDIPFGLADPTATTAPAQPRAANVTIYLVTADRQHLQAVPREVDPRSPVVGAVGALAAGPSDAEQALGLQTALPAKDLVRSVRVTDGVAAVDLDAAFQDIGGSNELLAIAQLVYTLTALPGVGQVAFSVSGGSVEVPRGDGSLTSGTVSREDYTPLAPAG